MIDVIRLCRGDIYNDEKTLLRQTYVYYHIFAWIANKLSLAHLSKLTLAVTDAK